MAALSLRQTPYSNPFFKAPETERLSMIFIVIHILFCHLRGSDIHLNIKVASAAHYASKRLH